MMKPLPYEPSSSLLGDGILKTSSQDHSAISSTEVGADVNPYSNWDEYGIRYQAEHLYKAELFDELYDLNLDKKWFEMQINFDPIRQTLANSLDWALLATESDEEGLSVLLVLVFMRATINSLTSRVPPAVLDLYADLGISLQAGAYATMQSDPLNSADALSSLAIRQGKQNNLTTAYATLMNAENRAQTIDDPIKASYALARIGMSAITIKATDIYERIAKNIWAILSKQKRDIVAMVNEFKLMDQPDYLFSLVEWERRQSLDFPDIVKDEHFNKYNPLPFLIQLACEKEDEPLLDALYARALQLIGMTSSTFIRGNDSTVFMSEGAILAALVDSGQEALAFEYIEEFQKTSNQDTRLLYETLSMVAGQKGNKDLIERAATAEKGPGTYLLLSGAFGLLPNYPNEAQIIWRKWVKNHSRFERLLLRLFPSAVIGLLPYPDLWDLAKLETLIGKKSNLKRIMSGWLNLYNRLAQMPRFFKPDDIDDAEFAVNLAKLGHHDRARIMAMRIRDDEKQAKALGEVIRFALDSADVEVALKSAEAIRDPLIRGKRLNIIAENLRGLSPDRGRVLIKQFDRYRDFLNEDEYLIQSPFFLVLTHHVALGCSLSVVMELINTRVSARVARSILPVLADVAVESKDLNEVQWVMDLLRKRSFRRIWWEKLIQRPLMNLLSPSHKEGTPEYAPILAMLGWTLDKEMERVVHIKAIARLAKVIGDTSESRKGPLSEEKGMKLAWESFRQAENQTRHLLPKWSQGWTIAALAEAARHLGSLKTIRRLHRKTIQLHPLKGTRDEALVQIALGLAESGEIFKRDRLYIPPAVFFIEHNYFKAQALIELSEITRSIYKRKGSLSKDLDQDALNFYADQYLQFAFEALGFSEVSYSSKDSDLSSLIGKFKSDYASLQSSMSVWQKVELLVMRFIVDGNREEWGIITAIANLFRKRHPPSIETTELAQHAMENTLVVLGSIGLTKDIMRIIKDLPETPYRSAIIATAAKELARVGHISLAQMLYEDTDNPRASTLITAGIACGLSENYPDRAERLLRMRVLPKFLDEGYSEETLKRTADAVLLLPESVRRNILCEILWTIRLRSRQDAMRVLAAFFPVAVTFLNRNQRLWILKQILEKESWWSAKPLLNNDEKSLPGTL